MNSREKFKKIARFELKGAVSLPAQFQWFWKETLVRWRKEGMPGDDHISNVFGFERSEEIPVNLGLAPVFDEEIISEDRKGKVYVDSSGVKKREYWDKADSSMPQCLEFPVKDRDSWDNLKKRLNPSSPARYPLNWEELKKGWKNRDYPLLLIGCGFYGWIRNWVGMENLALMFYDNPSLIHEMMEYIAYFTIEILKKTVNEVEDIDFVCFWEDMAYKTAPLVSPRMFRDFMLPNYKKVTSFLRDKGIDILLVDSDGNIEELIPLWLEGGVNGVYPLEAAAGMDAVSLRKKYGKNLILLGNIDKRVLSKGKKEIEEEVMKKVPYLLSQGGYFPGIDHSVPFDVPYQNYLYYLELLRKMGK